MGHQTRVKHSELFRAERARLREALRQTRDELLQVVEDRVHGRNEYQRQQR